MEDLGVSRLLVASIPFAFGRNHCGTQLARFGDKVIAPSQ